jgi:hypothetical protein
MATTPESKVKDRVKTALRHMEQELGISIYYHMPVQNGMGAPTLDFVGCLHGKFFAIECKAPGKKPTERQYCTIADMEAAGGRVFVYDGTDNDKFAAWLLKFQY